ncbi:sepiapterin reductase-like [Leucoraja erinacea]|uniref:sepiapterin reductase-like n=1 Tax=Leucoraja erinaceus TaxID=7782 RepID=UPI0024537613|nr:sepiapterin reductase-like [Leucoraja erinacea]
MAVQPGVKGTSLCIVTGASRGLGRSLALDLSASLQPGSQLVVAARGGEALRELQDGAAGSGVDVCPVQADLSGDAGLREVVRAVQRQQQQHGAPDRLLIINNAGTLGDISKHMVDFTQPGEVTSYMDLNFMSPTCLTAALLQAFPRRENFQRTVVNISSLCALQPFKSWSVYCAGKAARDMMFRCLAAEEPDVRVLNYAPGPLDNSMHEQARRETGDPELRQMFVDMHRQGQLLSCQESARKLLEILAKDEFESGAHIDYFDP